MFLTEFKTSKFDIGALDIFGYVPTKIFQFLRTIAIDFAVDRFCRPRLPLITRAVIVSSMRRVQLPLPKRQVRGKKCVLRRDRPLRRRDGRAEIMSAEHVRGVPSGHGPGEIVRRPLGLSRQNGRGLRRVSGRILQQNERL